MPRKPAKRGKNRPREATVASDEGMVGRLVDRAFENPAASGGLVLMAITACAILTNALFLQGHRHPGPLFIQGPSHIEALPPVPIPRARPISADLARQTDESLHDRQAADTLIVTNLQRELARLGLYVGPIDGVVGAQTETAISAYQKAAGLAVTGAPSAELLAFVTDRESPAVTNTATAAGAPTTAARQIAAEGQAAGVDGQINRRVQTALNLAGYGPIVVDGRMGAETADAIRRFELDNGLSITGEVGDRLLARLVAVGAMPAI